METWKMFDRAGALRLPDREVPFADIPWTPHPAFAGVALKAIVTSAQTDGQLSGHLVRIAPGMAIGNHVHEKQLETHEVIAGHGVCVQDGVEIAYAPGVVSILPANVPHAVTAGDDGLYLFAKFLPALV